ncbi:MAG: hypothetical protein QOH43_2751 [Solirubrobacteraceae bacterium]|jgi:hypothetical protein|nr:hypothetical protein [Solirubrobacteraceae bacterium]
MGETAVWGGASLGDMLERRRLEMRIHRIQRVLRALQDRHAIRLRGGKVPPPLGHTIEEFGRELADLRRRLDHLQPS